MLYSVEHCWLWPGMRKPHRGKGCVHTVILDFTSNKKRTTAVSIFSSASTLGWQFWEGCVLFYSSFRKINTIFTGDNYIAAVVARWLTLGVPHPAAFCHKTKKKQPERLFVSSKNWTNDGGMSGGVKNWISRFTSARKLWIQFIFKIRHTVRILAWEKTFVYSE